MKCTACQQDTIDARAKLPLLIGMPFRCRNCRAHYYIDRRDIGGGNFMQYCFFGGLIFVFIFWSIVAHSVWLLAGTILPAIVVLNSLPVALYSRKRHPTIQWSITLFSVIALGIFAFAIVSMSKTSQIHKVLLTDYLKANSMVLEMVGPIVDIYSPSSSSKGFSGVTEARHIFVVTGEHGSKKIGVISELSRDVEPPVLQVNELWLIKETGKEKIWP